MKTAYIITIIIALILAGSLFLTLGSNEIQETANVVQENPTEPSQVVVETPTTSSESSQGSRFNLEIDLPSSYEKIAAGDELWFTTKLINLENKNRIDVTLTYQILDSSGTIKYVKSETVAVETQASFVANLKTPESLNPGLHIVKVVLSSPSGESTAQTSLDIIAKDEEAEPQIVIKLSLFDIQVEIPEAYKQIQAGNELLTSIKLINVGTEGRIDIFLDYWITDESGSTILEEKETVAVETQNNFVRIFNIPEDTPSGEYTFHAKLSYPGLELEPEYATDFKIVPETKLNKSFLITILVALGLLVVFFFFRSESFKAFSDKKEVESKISDIVEKRQKN